MAMKLASETPCARWWRACSRLNLEDARPKARRIGRAGAALRKIKSGDRDKRELGSEFFLNARVDAFHIITDDPDKALAEAIVRGNAYAEAARLHFLLEPPFVRNDRASGKKRLKHRSSSCRATVAERLESCKIWA